MKFFIGIPAPDALCEQIARFQARFEQVQLAEPHISVKAQGGLAENEDWLPLIERSASGISPFMIYFAGVATFGDRVLFLKPAQSPNLRQFHQAVLCAINPSPELIARYHEGDHYDPHLTLATADAGMDRARLASMKEEAEIEFSDTASFTVSAIRVYRQLDPAGRYQNYRDISLSRQ